MAIEYYNVNDFDYTVISKAGYQKRNKGNQRSKKRFYYKDLYCAFDIETTNIKTMKQAVMYIWQFQIEDFTIIGRTWSEFEYFIDKVLDQLGAYRLLVYCHNLSFEFQFLKGVFPFDNDDVFATDRRKVVKAVLYDSIEFRCSYYLTNLSLAEFTKKMNVENKLSGIEFDYSKERYSWSELTERELEYCIVDVRSLVKALRVFFDIEHDNFYSIPLTSTGFVRRDVREAMRHYNRKKLKQQLPDYDLFCLLRSAFRGGNTHANRYYAGMICEDVVSYDRVSSYPDVQINELFPMGSWIYEGSLSCAEVCRKIYKHHRACIFKICVWGIYLKNPLDGCPYIAKHKCIKLGKHYNDNGRILQADYLELAVTDIDFKIIIDHYDYDDMCVEEFWHTRYGKLPKPLREQVIRYFELKTQLKNVPGEELFYFKSKNKLNSIYGLTVQSPVKQNIIFDGTTFETDHKDESAILFEANKKAFLSYAWGVWTTAHARYQLQIMIDQVGVENFLYCDTDSVKFFADSKVVINEYNNFRKKQSIKNGGIARDQEGNVYYLGLYEKDETYDRFVTMGAKKYAYEQNCEIGITVAGVHKTYGAEELEKAGGLEAFREGLVFYKAGGTTSYYNDGVRSDQVGVNGGVIQITDNCYIEDSTYTLGYTGDYKKILENPKIWLEL